MLRPYQKEIYTKLVNVFTVPPEWAYLVAQRCNERTLLPPHTLVLDEVSASSMVLHGLQWFSVQEWCRDGGENNFWRGVYEAFVAYEQDGGLAIEVKL